MPGLRDDLRGGLRSASLRSTGRGSASLWTPPSTAAAITDLGQVAQGSSTTQGYTVTFSAAVPAGALLVMFAGAYNVNSSPISSITDAKSPGWKFDAHQRGAVQGAGLGWQIARQAYASGDTITVQSSSTSSSRTRYAVIRAYTGITDDLIHTTITPPTVTNNNPNMSVPEPRRNAVAFWLANDGTSNTITLTSPTTGLVKYTDINFAAGSLRYGYYPVAPNDATNFSFSVTPSTFAIQATLLGRAA